MAKTGSITESSLTDDLAFAFRYGKRERQRRDAALVQKKYQTAFKEINLVLDRAIKEAENNPDMGIMAARQSTRFVMNAMPDPKQDGGRATMLSQFDALEIYLTNVKKPEEYLARMQKQFGPDLDPRNYTSGHHDAFKNIIKSQRQRLYAESKGLSSHQEQLFCMKRSELLAAVERGYTRLREQALGISTPDHKKGPQPLS
jgi:hypothetical protein